MAKLVDLSNEILLNITAFLTTWHPSGVEALIHLCLTSRWLCEVARPALYKDVHIREHAKEPLRLLKLFLRTLLESPFLGKKTQELTMINDLGVGYEWPGLEEDETFLEISRLLHGRGLEIEPDLCYYPLAAEVLARLPKLKHVHFTATIEPPRALVHRLHQLQSSQSILANLKTFHLEKQYELGPVDIKDYITFLQYPSFERFCTVNDAPDAPDGTKATNLFSHSVVELFWSMGPLSTTRQLLNTCTHLARFSLVIPDPVRYRYQTWEVGYEPLVTPRDLVRALLATQRNTLKILRLDFHHYYDLDDQELREELEEAGERLEDCDFTYPSFRDFVGLSHLTIEYERLVSVRDLPGTLVSVELQFCHFEELNADCLRRLSTLKGTRCPLIESIIISGWERANNGISQVQALAKSSELPLHVSADGRTLTMLGADCQFHVVSYELPA